jgi:hypothetical protein
MEASVATLEKPIAAPPPALFLIAATSILAGLLWDISWHKTIGRDTFWTPAHLAIHFGGILAGLTGAFLIFRTTFGHRKEDRAASVKVWGFRGPLGAWVSIWGCFAMVTSAPFDDWWHGAYGLDVKIFSPPHVVLAMGMFAVVYGALLIVVARQNRTGSGEPWLRFGYVYAGGLLVAMISILVSEYTEPNQQHGGLYYLIVALLFPYALAGLGRASRVRWPMTSIAAVYMAAMIAMNLILQPFPGHPKLAPIYLPVDHMVPFAFPIILIVPAFAADLVLRALRDGNDWLVAAAVALTFVGVLLATSWYSSQFLISPSADNAFFIGARHFPYFERPGKWVHDYWYVDTDRLTLAKLAAAFGLAFMSTRLGLMRGAWLRQVVR